MERSMIRLVNACFSYRSDEPVLHEVNLEIGTGLSLLLGPNGCGKSTLLKLAAGIEQPDRGMVEINGHDMWKEEIVARRELAYIPEQPDLTPYATIQDVLHLVCRLRSISLNKAGEVLEKVGLSTVAKRSIRELSMGQRRRAVLAAAWIGSPRIILLDEPLEAMDRAMREDLLVWINDLLVSQASVVIATHEIEPFVMKAARAITVRSAKARALESLPDPYAQRLEALESLSRGKG